MRPYRTVRPTTTKSKPCLDSPLALAVHFMFRKRDVPVINRHPDIQSYLTQVLVRRPLLATRNRNKNAQNSLHTRKLIDRIKNGPIVDPQCTVHHNPSSTGPRFHRRHVRRLGDSPRSWPRLALSALILSRVLFDLGWGCWWSANAGVR